MVMGVVISVVSGVDGDCNGGSVMVIVIVW